MIKAIVKSLNQDKATLELADGQSLIVQLAEIEGKIAPGLAVVLVACAPDAEDAARQGLAKTLINEILRP